MGNCNGEFQNVPDQAIEWQIRNRNYGELIGEKHLKFKPSAQEDQERKQRELVQYRKILNPDTIHYDNLGKSRRDNQANAPTATKPVVYQQIKQVKEYDPTFYQSLDLPQYIYKKIADLNEYKGNQYRPTQERRGVRYLGEWKNNVPHGKGILTSNVEQYRGWFCKGVKHEHGRQILADEVYQGPFVYGKRKGKNGILYKKDRTEEGDFDLILVHGTITYHEDNSKYFGALKQGIRQTNIKPQQKQIVAQKRETTQDRQDIQRGYKSKFTWDDGTIYIGEFMQDKINGKGKIIYPDGRFYYGQFQNQKKHGRGVFEWEKQDDIQRYEGQYQNDFKHGKGIFWGSYLKNRQFYYKGAFEYGKPHGSGQISDQNGIRVAQFYYGKEIK